MWFVSLIGSGVCLSNVWYRYASQLESDWLSSGLPCGDALAWDADLTSRNTVEGSSIVQPVSGSFRLRHVASGQYLCVVPGSVGSEGSGTFCPSPCSPIPYRVIWFTGMLIVFVLRLRRVVLFGLMRAAGFTITDLLFPCSALMFRFESRRRFELRCFMLCHVMYILPVCIRCRLVISIVRIHC